MGPQAVHCGKGRAYATAFEDAFILFTEKREATSNPAGVGRLHYRGLRRASCLEADFFLPFAARFVIDPLAFFLATFFFGTVAFFFFVAAAFLVAGFLVVGFLVAGFLAAAFLAVGFLVAGFLAAGFLAAGFLAAAFLAVGFAAAFFFSTVFLAAVFFSAAFLLGAAFLASFFFAALRPPRLGNLSFAPASISRMIAREFVLNGLAASSAPS